MRIIEHKFNCCYFDKLKKSTAKKVVDKVNCV